MMGQSYSHRVLSKLHLLSSVCVGVAKGVDSRLPRVSPGIGCILEQLPVVGPKCLTPSARIHILMSEDYYPMLSCGLYKQEIYYIPTSYRSS
jgi:hypothetical protein